MAYEKSAHMLAGGAVMVECGPMRLVIDARVGKVVQPQQALRAAEEAVRFLEGVAAARPLLGRDYRGLTAQITDPLVLKMVASIQAVGDEDLTPMAAVAGTIADAVADFLFERGMTRVLVDNGGDLAVRCCDGEPVAVGIRPNVANKSIAHVMLLGPERTAWGIATSGLGGRSLTRGVLEAATIVAADASLADAAATAVANAGYVEDRAVVRTPAEAIDPYTDIAGLHVTASVGPLPEKKKDQAVNQALRRAEKLIDNNIVLGAFVACQGRAAMTRFIAERLRTTS
ncbi:MAG: FAD:protein FMN transferase [Deltaproteobacteria bacterium]|nr:FAD:protein FMN transferase [Deltaproteobacteria bacterium]